MLDSDLAEMYAVEVKAKIEQSLAKKDDEIRAIFKIIKKLLIQEEKPCNPIGFRILSKVK